MLAMSEASSEEDSSCCQSKWAGMGGWVASGICGHAGHGALFGGDILPGLGFLFPFVRGGKRMLVWEGRIEGGVKTDGRVGRADTLLAN